MERRHGDRFLLAGIRASGTGQSRAVDLNLNRPAWCLLPNGLIGIAGNCVAHQGRSERINGIRSIRRSISETSFQQLHARAVISEASLTESRGRFSNYFCATFLGGVAQERVDMVTA